MASWLYIKRTNVLSRRFHFSDRYSENLDALKQAAFVFLDGARTASAGVIGASHEEE